MQGESACIREQAETVGAHLGTLGVAFVQPVSVHLVVGGLGRSRRALDARCCQ